MDSNFYFKNRQKSFTLIELLVVIAIIGLLSSIVLVSMGGVQGKARIIKTLEFSQSLNYILGAYLVGRWGFDESSGATALDDSGYGNNGIINGAVFTSETPQAIAGVGTGKYALSFDGVDDYVKVPDNNSLDMTDAITIEVWVKSDLTKPQNTILSKGFLGYSAYILSDGRVAFSFYANTQYTTYSGASKPVTANQWAHIVMTYDSADPAHKAKIFLNGSETPYFSQPAILSPYTMNTNDLDVMIGYYSIPNSIMSGLIDEVRIYERALSSAEIQKHYAEGLERHISYK